MGRVSHLGSRRIKRREKIEIFLTAMNLSPMVLAIRRPAALPKGSVAPDPRKQEEARTFQPQVLANSWTPVT